MELDLVRYDINTKRCIGKLAFNGVFFCYTLEDAMRKIKVPGVTAIPVGRYEIVITWSNRFQRPLPLLLNVPQFKGIRIHSGNIAENTEGCILTGLSRSLDSIGQSRMAFNQVFQRLSLALETDRVFIEVRVDPMIKDVQYA